MAQPPAEFTAIYRAHANDVLRLALYLSGDRMEAEDITSETFVAAWTTPTAIVAGEASAGTRVLVTEYLARDPDLAEQVRRQQAEQPASVSPSVAPDLEMTALLRTRCEIEMRAWALGLGWFFSALSLGVNATVG